MDNAFVKVFFLGGGRRERLLHPNVNEPRERLDTLVIWQEARKGQSTAAFRCRAWSQPGGATLPAPGSPRLSSGLGLARLLSELETRRLLEKGEGERPRVEEAPRTGWQGWAPLPFMLVCPVLPAWLSWEPTFLGPAEREPFEAVQSEQVSAETFLLQRKAHLHPSLCASTVPLLGGGKRQFRGAATPVRDSWF